MLWFYTFLPFNYWYVFAELSVNGKYVYAQSLQHNRYRNPSLYLIRIIIDVNDKRRWFLQKSLVSTCIQGNYCYFIYAVLVIQFLYRHYAPICSAWNFSLIIATNPCDKLIYLSGFKTFSLLMCYVMSGVV